MEPKGPEEKRKWDSPSGSKCRWIYLEPWGKEIGRKRRRMLKPLNRTRLLEVMARCPRLCEIELEDIKQIGFIPSSEGEEVTKALFYSECIRRLALQAEAELGKEGIRLVQQSELGCETQDGRVLTWHAGLLPDSLYNNNQRRCVDGNNGSLRVTVVTENIDPQWRNRFEPLVDPRDNYRRGELSVVD
ncbi:hypothetical protein NDU88_004720 [Pleurodeles waltl]|uniref:Uncharacterized protein n=1 Tax=Pleurodeles waltl TaxID=8319 RepID=A0AAV7QIN1_PLEWA|nr:hypothetical protein NDU88_004720 [Pleurodeles waltl]